ncbi:MAG: hypothetical protein CRU78_04575 [Candidatus Accumulibacter phosphatis]|jgi:hypothetical protein|uniref:Glycosyltransferase 2-like domain-containing protein n=1 Tax=Candidatus Accumulibacter phosphatis TaxID=327160 RepID=A0A6A7RSF4_9PROT|nr:hypothetical protein [Candidatus Accumulibacter phosphatis]
MFDELRSTVRGFAPYEQGYALACKRLGKSPLSEQPFSTTTPIEVVHPNSKSIAESSARVICVVTTVLNGEKFLGATLASVLSQSGDFFIDYFIKDAGSTDGTASILQDCCRKIASGRPSLNCLGIRIRVESMPDSGLYDALHYSFKQDFWRNDPSDILTYINADDVFHVGAFEIACQVFLASPAKWICGQKHIINANGDLVVTPQFPLSYSREDIEAGLHDGRSLYFIQQEGSFWLREIYSLVGGIDLSLKLAGDFDLWQRFAAQTELLALDRPLGSFRSHGGQLSSEIDKYYAEVDGIQRQRCCQPPSAAAGVGGEMQYFLGTKAPKGAREQRLGPVCFLSADGKVSEIAYIKRGWVTW